MEERVIKSQIRARSAIACRRGPAHTVIQVNNHYGQLDVNLKTFPINNILSFSNTLTRYFLDKRVFQVLTVGKEQT